LRELHPFGIGSPGKSSNESIARDVVGGVDIELSRHLCRLLLRTTPLSGEMSDAGGFSVDPYSSFDVTRHCEAI
jgi:hypothetical protein